MRLLYVVGLAASFTVLPAVHAADKAAKPTEVRGVKLDSICIDCAVVSDIRQESARRKGSKGAADGAAGASAVADPKAKTVWTTTVVFKGGTTQTYQQSRKPALQPGDVVIVQEGVPRKYVN